MHDYDDLTDAPEDALWAQLGEAEGLVRADVLMELARRAHGRGESPRAVTLLDEAAGVAEGLDDLRLAAYARYRQGAARFGMGDYAGSASAYRRSADQARATGRSSDEAHALWGLADALRVQRDWAGALEAAESCRALALAEEIPGLAGGACLIAAKALYWLDREQDSLAACAEGRDHYRSAGRAADVARIDDFALTVRLYLGQLDEALELARGCHILARNTPTTEDDAYATRRLAEVHLRRDDLDEAFNRAEEARELYRRADNLLGVARCDMTRGKVLWSRHEAEAAQEVFTESRALFDACGADDEALECDSYRAVLLHNSGRFREAAAVNRHIIDALRHQDLPHFTDLPWAVGRLAGNEFAAGDAQSAIDVIEQWEWLWDGEAEGRASKLRLVEVKAQALAEVDRLAEAAEVASAALDLTTEAEVNAQTARLYEVRARWLLDGGDPSGRQDLAHAIALHLAFGSTARAAELSEFFLPTIESAPHGLGERPREDPED